MRAPLDLSLVAEGQRRQRTGVMLKGNAWRVDANSTGSSQIDQRQSSERGSTPRQRTGE